MQLSKEMFLISPADYRSLMERGEAPPEVNINKLHSGMMENKILSGNLEQKAWEKYGTQMSKIISEGVDKSAAGRKAPISAIGGLPAAPASRSKPQSEASFIKQNVPGRLKGKVTKLYNRLNQLPGVTVDTNSIVVDGTPLAGATLDIIKRLVSDNKFVRYELGPLYFRMSKDPEIIRLVANKEATRILTEMRNQGVKEDPSLSEMDDTSFQDASSFHSIQDPKLSFNTSGRDTSTPKRNNKKQKGNGMPPKRGRSLKKWSSLF